VLDAATMLLQTHGPTALSIRRIAATAGVAPMTVYNRFGSKQGVLDFLFIAGFESLNKALAFESSGNVEDDLVISGRRYRAFALENPTRYMLMFLKAVPDYAPSIDASATATQSFMRLVEMVRLHQRIGHFVQTDPKGTHPGNQAVHDIELAQRIWSSMHGAISLELMGIGFVDDQARLVDGLSRTLARGLVAEASLSSDPAEQKSTKQKSRTTKPRKRNKVPS
jgi:AcrR family transcriptional regulator